MSDERRTRVRQLFHDAVELEESARAAFLDEHCGDDPALRQEVEGLLRRDSPSVAGPITPVFDRLVPEAAPESIGHYRIVGRLGEGGFGEVYEGEQTEPFQRRVAIKVVKAGMDTRAVLARFDAERQALALLNHPGIAKVFDAGETARGRSYFVMELVQGEPITEFCDRSDLGIHQRLDLFLAVCDAVRHAHQKGIIHRDLKPSNILVTTEAGAAAPKVIDFGIAKATGHALTQNTLYTEAGQLVGTPEYMSPEQAELAGADVDIRTDVYSLGVILYELLTGVLPFDPVELRASGISRIQEIIGHQEPHRPSTRLSGEDAPDRARRRASTPNRLSRNLRRDLDWIVLRAMEKDRNRRYASVEALAADIARFRNDQPVEAGPPSVAYRARKFSKRYRVALAVVAVVFASIFYALFESNRQRLVAEDQRMSAERARDEAEEVTGFLSRMLGSVDPRARGKDVSVREILDEGAKTIESEFPDQPLVRARLMLTMGRVYAELGHLEQAIPLVQSAAALRDAHLDDDDATLAYTYNNLGILMHQSARHEEARTHYNRALEIWRRAYGGDNHQNIAQAFNNLANTYWSAGQFAEARPLMERALAIREQVRGPEHLDIAQSLNNLGVLAASVEDYEGSIRYIERALAIREKHLDPGHPDIAQCIQNIGETEMLAGDFENARVHLARALEMQVGAFGPRHRETAMTLSSLGRCTMALGDFPAARDYLQRALETGEDVLGSEHPDVAETLVLLGQLRIEEGAPAEARPLLERAIGIFRAADLQEYPVAQEAGQLLDSLDAPK